VLFLASIALFASTPAWADHGLETTCSDGWITEAGSCKYAKAKDRTHCVDQLCTKITIDEVKWRGGTASGSCDPSNNIVKWRLLNVKIVRASDSVVRWKYGPGNYHTNCDVDATTYTRTPNLTVSQDHWVKYNWEFVESTGVTFKLHVGLLVSPR
jgi:hypothetical protein